MTHVEFIDACTGFWTGRSILNLGWDPKVPETHESQSTMSLEPCVGDTGLLVRYSWSHDGEEQFGCCLIVLIGTTVEVGWSDTFHMNGQVMRSTGCLLEDGIEVLGHYPAPPGPDWGWRTSLSLVNGTLSLKMTNIEPAGDETWAVDAQYSKQS